MECTSKCCGYKQRSPVNSKPHVGRMVQDSAAHCNGTQCLECLELSILYQGTLSIREAFEAEILISFDALVFLIVS